ncbi:MAG: putative lipid II flippase FtsW [Desulfobacterales bacterium]|nr:putative lipid II flippase FtsW [Desulfobacterales bacterium]
MPENKKTNQTACDSVLPYDMGLMLPVLFLVGIGIVIVYSASSAYALSTFGNDYFFLKKQLVFFLLGSAALLICRHVPLNFVHAMAYPALFLAMVLLLAIHLTPFGNTVNGSARWLRLGNFSFQPSEPARLALVIYLSHSISKKGLRIREFSIGLLPHILVLATFVGLIALQPDLGSIVIFGAITWILLFVGGARFFHLTPIFLTTLPLLYLYLMSATYRMRRLLSFWNPWQYASDEGYQITHSLMAFGSGGIWGAGFGNSYQKLFYLPEPHTDFIFSVIGEELGLVGVLLILGLYIFIFWRGLSISRLTGDAFESLLAVGLTISIGLQACVNMGVVLGLLPTKGLTLPFISYGGTSLITNLAAIGLLMNIAAKNTRQRVRKENNNKDATG